YEGRVLLPNRYKHMILHQYHGHVSVGHPGETRTLKGIQKIFKWPQMRRDVQNWIKSCLRCSRVKTGRERLQGLRRVNPIQDPFQAVHIDYFHYGESTIMTMIDRATRWVEATIVSDKSAEKATEAFMHYWVSRFGVPKYVISDNEKSLTSVFMKNWYFVLGARGCTTMIYHPQGNSPIESYHNLFRSQIVACQEPRWLATQEYLDTILLAYRNSYHTALGDSPAFLTYG